MVRASRQTTLSVVSKGKGVGSGTFPDSFVDSLATVVAAPPTADSFHSWMGMDPMLVEAQGRTVGTRDTVSLDYAPVLAEWIPPIFEDRQTMEVVAPLLNALSPLQVLKSTTGLTKEAHVECIL
jgi:hypothetical protein